MQQAEPPGVPAVPPGQFRDGGAGGDQGQGGAGQAGGGQGTSKDGGAGAGPSTSAPQGDSASVTTDDSKTFAYGTTDLAAITRDAADMASTVDQLSTDISTLDVTAAKADAKTLEKQATQLAADSVDATDRMDPLAPNDATLKDAREDCLKVYALAAAYAAAALRTSNALKNADAKELRDALAEVNDLEGTSDDLSDAYDKATKELQKWAKANPTAASAAIAKYGD
jgi:hypothetical protein